MMVGWGGVTMVCGLSAPTIGGLHNPYLAQPFDCKLSPLYNEKIIVSYNQAVERLVVLKKQ